MADNNIANVGGSTPAAHTGHWTKTADKSGTYEFQTAGKFVDKNIDLVVPAATLSLDGDISQTTANSLAISGTTVDTTLTDGKFALKSATVNLTNSLTTTASSKGFTNDGSYTGSETQDLTITGTVNAASATNTLSASNLSVTSDGGTYDGTAKPGKYTLDVKIGGTISNTISSVTAGWINSTNKNSFLSKYSENFSNKSASFDIDTAIMTLSGSATESTPQVEISTTANQTGNVDSTPTTIKPSSGYYLAVKASTDPATGTVSATVDKAGYMFGMVKPSDASFNIGGKSSTYYLPITKGTISTSNNNSTSASDLSGYTQNTTAIVPSGGSLKLSAGWYPDTFITLATLVPNEATIDKVLSTANSNQLLKDYKAYDKDGTLLTGTIETVTPSVATNASATATGTSIALTSSASKPTSGSYITISGSGGSVTTPAGYIASETTTSTTLATKYYTIASQTITNTNTTAKVTASIDKSAASDILLGTQPTTAGTYITVPVTLSESNVVKGAVTSGVGYQTTSTVTTPTVTITKTGANLYITKGAITTDNTTLPDGATTSGTVTRGNYIKVTKGIYLNDMYFGSNITGSDSGITGTLSSSVDNVLLNTAPTGSYITITGNGTMTKGDMYNGQSTAAVKYISIYDGTYSYSA